MNARTIALFSSARRNGNTGRLLDRVVEQLDIEVVDLAEKNIAHYDYRHRNRSDDFETLMQRVLAADNIVFASPVYWYGVNAPMKTFLDRISDYLDLPELRNQGRRLRGKTAYVLSTSVGRDIDPVYLEALKKVFRYLGMRFGGYLHADCRDGYRPQDYEIAVEGFVNSLRGAAVIRGGASPEPTHTGNLRENGAAPSFQE